MLCVLVNKNKKTFLCEAEPDIFIEKKDYARLLKEVSAVPLSSFGDKYINGIIIGILADNIRDSKSVSNAMQEILKERKELNYYGRSGVTVNKV